jgi:hypothetical protein
MFFCCCFFLEIIFYYLGFLFCAQASVVALSGIMIGVMAMIISLCVICPGLFAAPASTFFISSLLPADGPASANKYDEGSEIINSLYETGLAQIVEFHSSDEQLGSGLIPQMKSGTDSPYLPVVQMHGMVCRSQSTYNQIKIGFRGFGNSAFFLLLLLA